jgi:hypothetical protein
VKKCVIRLKVKDLMKAQIDMDIRNDTQLAACIGVSVTQVWRTKLPVTDPRHNSPGTAFISGVMNAFESPFERFFYLDDESIVESNTENSIEYGKEEIKYGT